MKSLLSSMPSQKQSTGSLVLIIPRRVYVPDPCVTDMLLYCRLMGSLKDSTRPYHGVQLAKIIDKDKLDWDDKLDTILMGYRAS